MKMLKDILLLYNKDEYMEKATDLIEKSILKLPTEDIPRGLIQALFGSIRKIDRLMILGIQKAFNHSKERWRITVTEQEYENTLWVLSYLCQGDFDYK